MAEAEWSAGNFHSVLQGQIKNASFLLDVSYQNIAGVKLPVFIEKESDYSIIEKIAVTQGGSQIERARLIFKELLETLVAIASL